MSQSADTRHRREKERGGHDFHVACSIIDDARICHVGFNHEGHVYVIPMACARSGTDLLLHGSVASRLINDLSGGMDCCVTITHLDGLVLARSAFHSSMNYRSVMVFGKARLVEEPALKNAGLDRLVEQLLPGRLSELRESTRKELKATHLLALPIEHFSTKIRTGPPSDPSADLGLPLWAGVVPLKTVAGEPQAAPDMQFDIPPPAYLEGYDQD